MHTGGFGTTVIADYGNGASTNNALPAIDSIVRAGSPLNFSGPSLNGPHRLAIIERLTPRNINATQSITNVRSRALVAITFGTKGIVNRIAAGGRAIATLGK